MDTIEEMKDLIRKVQINTITPQSLSSIKNGFTILPILSSKHFRTPVLPFFWQTLVI